MEPFQATNKWVGIAVLVCLVFSGTLFFVNLGKRDLWNPDEPRYSEIAREMVVHHTLLVPHLNEKVYTQKPPLFFWMVAASFKLFQRINEFTARFPVALSAVLCVLLTFLIGKRLFDPVAGFFSALALATASEFFWLANRVNLDTVMTLFILASIYAIVRALGASDHRNLWFRLAFFFAGLGTVTKGPLGFIVPFLTLVVFLIVKGEGKKLVEVPWVTGMGIFLLTLMLGLGPTCLAGGKAYTQELIFRQTVTRYVHGINHQKGFWFFFYVYPETLLPWVFFLPGAIWLALKKKKDPEIWRSFLFVFVWIGANLLFLSFSGSKRQLYILSLVPAGCLLVGDYFSRLARGMERVDAWFKVPVYLLGGGFVVIGIVLPFVPYGIRYRFPELTLPLPPFIVLAILGIMMGLLVSFLNGKGKVKAVLALLFLGFYIIFFVGAGWILPLFDKVKSPRALGEKIQALVEEGYDVRTYGGLEHAGILFYTRLTRIPVVLPVPEEMGYLKTAKKAAVVLRKRQLKRFASLAHVPLEVLWQGRVGHRIFLILKPQTF